MESQKIVTVTVNIDPSLKRTKKRGLSVYLNGSRAGDIFLGDVLQFSATEPTNFIQLGWINKKPFDWPDSTYSFDIAKIEGVLELTITVIGMMLVIKRN